MSAPAENKHLAIICGKSATGKSTSLMNLKNPEGVIYLNCEAGKRLPFRSKFKELVVTDPMTVYQAFQQAEQMPEVHTIVVDSLTYLMDMYESKYVLTAANTMKAWSEYAQYFKNLMQQYVAASTKNVIFLAHTVDQINEQTADMETFIPVKGSLKNQGIESFVNIVLSTKKMPLKNLTDYESSLLNITEEEQALGFKYVYQTKLTKNTTGERIRGPMGMFSTKETFMDNDMQLFIDRLHEYYD